MHSMAEDIRGRRATARHGEQAEREGGQNGGRAGERGGEREGMREGEREGGEARPQ